MVGGDTTTLLTCPTISQETLSKPYCGFGIRNGIRPLQNNKAGVKLVDCYTSEYVLERPLHNAWLALRRVDQGEVLIVQSCLGIAWPEAVGHIECFSANLQPLSLSKLEDPG